MSDINEETSTEYSGDYPEIAAAYKAGEELSDEQLDTIADVAISILRSILGYFDASDSPIDEYEGDEGELILDVTAPDLAVLIGRHGRTLDALQMVLTSLMSSRIKFYYPIVVDIEGYKSRRRKKIEDIARSAAARHLADVDFSLLL